MKQLHVCRDGENIEGPYLADDVWRMVQGGQLSPEVQTCLTDGTADWMPFHDQPDSTFTEAVLPNPNRTIEPAADSGAKVSSETNPLIWVAWIIILSLFLLAALFSQRTPEEEKREMTRLKQEMEKERRAKEWLSVPENRKAFLEVQRLKQLKDK